MGRGDDTVLREGATPSSTALEGTNAPLDCAAPDAISLAFLAEHGFDMISVHAVDGTFLSVGKAGSQIHGWQPQELVGRSAWELVHPDDRHTMQEVYSLLLAEGNAFFSCRFRRADGSHCWIEVRARMVTLDTGEWRILSVARDVSERREAERLLREQHELMSATFLNAPIGMALLEPCGRILEANDRLCEFLHRSQGELRSRELATFVPPDERQAMLDELALLREGRISRVELERQFLRSDGAPVYGLVAMTVARAEGSGAGPVVVQIVDITERRRAERALREQAEELRALSLEDPLTGLCNRRGFLTLAKSQLATAARLGKRATLIFVDLDGLKEINDRFGHEAGDSALGAAGRILRETFRESDVVGRLGGDEFAICAVEGEEAPEATFLERLDGMLRAYNEQGQHPWSLAVSAGSARFDPAAPRALEELLAQADRAMYAQKRDRKKARQVA